MEKAKKNEIVDIDGTSVYKVDNSKIKIVIQGNSEKIPLSVWLQLHLGNPSESELLELQKHLIGIAASVCIGTECYHAGACSTNLCNTKQNLIEITQLKTKKTTPTTDTITISLAVFFSIAAISIVAGIIYWQYRRRSLPTSPNYMQFQTGLD